MSNDNIDLDEISDRMIDPHKYEYVERLGAGKFGEVYKVKDDNNNYFALKQINVFEELKFNREVYILSLLDHPCVLNLEGFSKPQEGQPATIVTQLLSSKDLKDVVLENPSDWTATKKMINMYGIALGMDYCHSKYVLHRDLKPENILLNSRYEPHIADFGLSKVTDVYSMLIQSNVTGTPSFTAPEMLDDESCNEKMDVYSYAIIVYFIFTGETPYQEVTNYNNFKNLITMGLDDFKIPDEIPELYRDLISSCWAKDPESRPSFEEIVAALSNKENYLDGINVAEFEEYKRRVDNGIRLKEGEEPIIELNTNEETQETESNEEPNQTTESNEETNQTEANEETKELEAVAETEQLIEANDENNERNNFDDFESSSSSTTSSSSESTDDENENEENDEVTENNEADDESKETVENQEEIKVDDVNEERDDFDDSESSSTSSSSEFSEEENKDTEEGNEIAEQERNNEKVENQEENKEIEETNERDNFDDSESSSTTSSSSTEDEAENEEADENKENTEKLHTETSELTQNEEKDEEKLAADSQDTKDENNSNSPSFVIDQQNIDIGPIRERSFNLIPMNEEQETSGESTKLEEPDKNAPNPLWVVMTGSEITEKPIESEFGQMQQEVGENNQSKEVENPLVMDNEETTQLNLQQDEYQNKEETNKQEELVDPPPWILQPEEYEEKYYEDSANDELNEPQKEYENKEEKPEQEKAEILAQEETNKQEEISANKQEELADPSSWILQPEEYEEKYYEDSTNDELNEPQEEYENKEELNKQKEITEETPENQAEEKDSLETNEENSEQKETEITVQEELVDPPPWILQPEEYETKEEKPEQEETEILAQEEISANKQVELVDPSSWVLQPEEYENKEENKEDPTTSISWVVQPECKGNSTPNSHLELQSNEQQQQQDEEDIPVTLNVVTKSIPSEITQIVEDCIATQNARELISRLHSACDTETKSAVYEKIRVDSPAFYTELINEGLNQDDSFTHHKRGLNLIVESSQSTDTVERMAKLREAEKEFKKSIQSGQSYSYLPLSLVYYTMPNREVSAFNAASEGAKRGDKKCGCLRGFFISRGIGTKREFDKGVLIILDNKVASLHDQFATDIAIHKARKCNPDEPSQSSQKVEAFKWFEKAFNLRKTRATINNYGLCFLTGFGCQKDTQKAMDVFRIGVQKNDADSMYHTGFILEEDDPIESLRLYKEAADKSNVDAQNYYAYLKSKTDKNESVKYFNMAASQNNQMSMTSLAKLLTSTEKEKALSLLKKAAFAGNTEAQEILAKKYSNENDIENAHLYLNMLSKSGNCEVPTEYALNLYKMRKFKHALYWFKKMAEENNNPIAIYFLGVMMFHGHGCEKNKEEAYRIMKDLSKKGVGKASDFIDNYFEEKATLSSM